MGGAAPHVRRGRRSPDRSARAAGGSIHTCPRTMPPEGNHHGRPRLDHPAGGGHHDRRAGGERRRSRRGSEPGRHQSSADHRDHRCEHPTLRDRLRDRRVPRRGRRWRRLPPRRHGRCGPVQARPGWHDRRPLAGPGDRARAARHDRRHRDRSGDRRRLGVGHDRGPDRPPRCRPDPAGQLRRHRAWARSAQRPGRPGRGTRWHDRGGRRRREPDRALRPGRHVAGHDRRAG